LGEAAAATVITPPSSKKRKLDTTASATSRRDSQDKSHPPLKSLKASHQDNILDEAVLPATPLTLVSDKPMDSDDDFNSIASSDALEIDEDNSSVDFGAGGKLTSGNVDGMCRAVLTVCDRLRC
jgi:hypothetical protein